MNPGIASLTDKEKQTLRLLLSGYDAKSMARRLGLSVHTINERLRDSRRKMGTSSSREAARLLLSAEGRSHDFVADRSLGDAPPAALGDGLAHQPANVVDPWRPAWIIGGIAMLLALALAALTSLPEANHSAAPPSAAASAAVAQHTQAESEASDAARRWLELVDAKDWKASYDRTTTAFRAANSLEGWSAAAASVHGQFGPARSRVLVSADETPAPPAGNVVVKFRASYANKPQGTELLTLVREDGAWKVSGIYVS